MILTKENISSLDFDKGAGLLPCIAQDSETLEVLMVGFVNAGALIETFDSNKLTFYSRSKERLWTKGETSGNYLNIRTLYFDCDQDAILAMVKPNGPVCHTGSNNCFGTSQAKGDVLFFNQLQNIIRDRHINPQSDSYVSSLFEKGINKIAQKVGEEAVELVIEAKDDNEDLFINEAADLFFHYLILLEAKGYELSDVLEILEKRNQKAK